MTGPSDEYPGSLIDTGIELAPGAVLAWCINPSGEPTAWILNDDPRPSTGSATPRAAPHEQPGPLPTEYRDRIEQTVPDITPRCRSPRRANGQPYRSRVRRHGDRCTWHRPPDELEALLDASPTNPQHPELQAEHGRRSAADRTRRLDKLHPGLRQQLEDAARAEFPRGAYIPWQILTLRMVEILAEEYSDDA